MGQSTLDRRHRGRTATIATAAAVGLLVVLVGWAVWGGGSVSPRTVEGWAMPNATGTAISLHESPQDVAGEGYVVAGARWRGPDNVWHEGADAPTCVGTDPGTFTRVRLGLVTVEAPDDVTWHQVAWLECLQ